MTQCEAILISIKSSNKGIYENGFKRHIIAFLAEINSIADQQQYIYNQVDLILKTNLNRDLSNLEI